MQFGQQRDFAASPRQARFTPRAALVDVMPCGAVADLLGFLDP